MPVDTKNLIDSLASDLEEVRCARHPLKSALPWFVFAVIYITLAIVVLGIRDDFLLKIYDSSYVFEIGLILAMSASATFCSLFLCFPDMRGHKWMLSVPFCLFLVLLFWIAVQLGLDVVNIPRFYWSGCINEAVIYGLIPAATLVLLASRGKTTHPKLMSFMNTIAIGGLGYLALRITCSVDEIGHIMVHHFLPYVLIGFIIAVAGIKIYRW